jgi:hypothetical protein
MLGEGFGKAFKEVASIARYAQPAINLLKLAFTAFAQGDAEVGMVALRAGFSGLVDIVQNQLVAAWERFKQTTMSIWVMFNKIWVIVTSLGDALIDGVFTQISQLFGGIGRNISSIASIFGSKGGSSSMEGTLKQIAIVINNSITFLASTFLDFQFWGDNWIARMKIAFAPLLIASAPQKALQLFQQGLIESTQAELAKKTAKDGLEERRLKREEAINKAFEKTAEELAEQSRLQGNAANNRSRGIGGELQNLFGTLAKILRENTARRTREQQALAAQQTNTRSTPSSPRTTDAERQLFGFKLDSLVVSIQSSQNKYLKQTSTQVDEQKTTNELLREQNRILKTQGAF